MELSSEESDCTNPKTNPDDEDIFKPRRSVRIAKRLNVTEEDYEIGHYADSR